MTLKPSDIRGVGVQMSKLHLINSFNDVSSHQTKKAGRGNESQKHSVFQCDVPEFLGCRDSEKIIGILKTWAESDEPMQIDVDKVDAYFNDLIKYGNISLTEKILRDLRKHFVARDIPEWNAVFNAILQNVQQKIFSEFNGILSVDNL